MLDGSIYLGTAVMSDNRKWSLADFDGDNSKIYYFRRKQEGSGALAVQEELHVLAVDWENGSAGV